MINQKKIDENIISALGIESLPDERKIAMLKKMGELVQKRILLLILKQLDIGEKENFLEATANDDHSKAQEILDKHNINMLEMIEEEAVKLKDELKDRVGELSV